MRAVPTSAAESAADLPTDLLADTSDGASSARSLGVVLGLLALVWLATFAVFRPALQGELVYDDRLLVARNPLITSFENVGRMFTSNYWDFFDPEEAKSIGYWRPLTALALATGWALGDGRPAPFHALSLTLHLLATAVVFRLALRLTRSPVAACAAGVVFGLHPLHVESVAWISAINDPLYGLFALLALDAWVAWRQRGSPGTPWLACACLAIALLAKEMALALVPAALAIDLARGAFRDARDPERGFLRGFAPFTRGYAPLLAVVGLYWLARVLVFGELSAGFGRTTTHYFGFGALRLAQLRIEMLGEGLLLSLWPRDLVLFRMVVPNLAWTDGRFLLQLGAVLALAVAIGLALWRRCGRMALALLLFPATLLPALVATSSIGMFPVSDRFFYVPLAGLALLAALGAKRLPVAATAAVVVAIGAGYAWRASERIEVWANEPALMQAAVEQSPRTPYVHWTYGRVLLDRFHDELDAALLDQALAHFEQANELVSAARAGDDSIFAALEDRKQANLGTAQVYLEAASIDPLKDYATPRELYRLITDTFPDEAIGWNGLGLSYGGLGQLDEARRAFDRALTLNERDPAVHFNLGELQRRRGDLPRAKKSFERALALRPNHLETLIQLAAAEAEGGNPERGVGLAERARDLFPADPGPHVLLGQIASASGDYRASLKHLDRALELDPDHGGAHLERGKVLLAMNEVSGAITQLRRAVDRRPRNFEAHWLLGWILVQSRAFESALPVLDRAYEIGGDDARMRDVRGLLLEAGPDTADFALRYGRMDLERNDVVGASAWVERALQLDDGNPAAHYLDARVRSKSGANAAALQAIERALAIEERFFLAHVEAGAIQRQLGNDEEALRHWKRALELGAPEEWEAGLKQVATDQVKKQIAAIEARAGRTVDEGAEESP